MNILSHRGWWNTLAERNSAAAFQRSFSAGFGTETDVRDLCGTLVVSHDMPSGDEMLFEDVLKIMDGRNLPLAINIKADGLVEPLLEMLSKYRQTCYFTFDMSIPDLVVQTTYGANVFTGLSDIVPAPVLLDKCCGIWLDAFFSEWYGADLIDGLLESGKQICIVSPDLHKRNPFAHWEVIRSCRGLRDGRLMLCTDMPDKAREFFA